MDDARESLRQTFDTVLADLLKKRDDKVDALSRVEDTIEDIKGQIAAKERKLAQAEQKLEAQKAVVEAIEQMIHNVNDAADETRELQRYIFQTLEHGRLCGLKVDDPNYPTNSQRYKDASREFGELMEMTHAAPKEAARLFYGKARP